MRGFGAFAAKEAAEIVKTWRIWVLPGIVLFFAATGPVLAKLTPELLRSVATSPGMVIELPTPTYTDAYLQWAKNLGQLVTFAVIIIFAGLVSAERRSGTAVLVLTKPLSRPAFVLAKYLAAALLLAGSVAVGALLTWGVTAAVFGEAPFVRLARATGTWLVWGLLLLALMTLLSVLIDSQAGAAGLGLAAFLVISVASLWGPGLRFTPAGLIGAPTDLVTGAPTDVTWPLLTAIAAAVLLLASAVAAFSRKEL